MSTFKANDGTPIYYKDWGKGPVVMFSHGWPLNADAWDGQMLFLAQNGYRVIAHDRRGHGRSDQASTGKSARLIKGAKDVYYPGAPHGITTTHQCQVNEELLAFLRR